MSFLGEIKRRKVFQVAAVYAVVAWLLVQIVDVVNEPLSLPDWFDTAVIMALAIGFPIALVLAWAFDLTPEGIVKDTGAMPGSSRRIEIMFIALLAVAVGTLLYREFTPASEDNTSDLLPNSIAILPFENLSPDPDDASVAAGIHTQLLFELSKIQDLSVIARTTMLRYAESPPPIPELARELRVEAVMEAVVRIAGDRVRVNAQLIDGHTGTPISASEHTGDLTDIFALQSEIAMGIVDELGARLTPDEQEELERPSSADSEAVRLYLSAIPGTNTLNAIPVLEAAIEIDPDFAEARALLAYYQANAVIGFGTPPDQAEEFELLAEMNAVRALERDNSLGAAHAALGALYLANWRGPEADESLGRAYELNPNDVNVAMMYARLKRHRREYDEAIDIMERAAEIDPESSIIQQNLGVAYRYRGRYEEAVAANRRGLNLESTSESLYFNLALAEAGLGNETEAIDAVKLGAALAGATGPGDFRLAQMTRTYALVGRLVEARETVDVLEQSARAGTVGEAALATAYAAIGEHETAIEHLQRALSNRVSTDAGSLGQLAAYVFVDPALEDDPRYAELLGTLWDDD